MEVHHEWKPKAPNVEVPKTQTMQHAVVSNAPSVDDIDPNEFQKALKPINMRVDKTKLTSV